MGNQLKAGAILTYVALILNSIISIIYTPIMLKLLGQSEYGLYSLAVSSASYVGILNFGLGNAVIRYTAKYRALGDDEGCSRIYGLFSIMYGTLGIIALVSGVVLTIFSPDLFSNSLTGDELYKLRIIMGIMVTNLSIGIGLGLFSVIALAHEKFVFQKMIGIVSSIVNPLIMLPLLMMGYGSISVALITTILNFISILVNIHYCFRVLKIKIKFGKFQIDLIKEIFVFSSFVFLNLIIEKLYWSTDQIILGVYSGTVAVSIYSIGATFSGYFSGFAAAISNVFLSKVTRMVITEVPDKEISDLFIRVGRVQYIILSFALGGFIVFGQEFIQLWVGPEYSDSFYIALIILVPAMIALIQGMGGIILQAKNKHKFKSILYLVIAICNVFLSIIFVKKWGGIGCALATGLAYMVGNVLVMNYYYWKKIHIDIPKFWKNILFMSAALLVSILFGATANRYLLADTWIILVGKIFAFSIFYLLMIWFVGMNNYERDLLSVPLKRMLHVFNREIAFDKTKA